MTLISFVQNRLAAFFSVISSSVIFDLFLCSFITVYLLNNIRDVCNFTLPIIRVE